MPTITSPPAHSLPQPVPQPCAPRPGSESAMGRPTETRQRAHLDAANAAELQANVQHIVSLVRAAGPKNTSKGYEPKQQEFKVGR